MDNKILFKVYGKTDHGFADTPKKISFRKSYILDTYGWRIYWIVCYCPMCNGPRKSPPPIRTWKKYRKTQYK